MVMLTDSQDDNFEVAEVRALSDASAKDNFEVEETKALSHDSKKDNFEVEETKALSDDSSESDDEYSPEQVAQIGKLAHLSHRMNTERLSKPQQQRLRKKIAAQLAIVRGFTMPDLGGVKIAASGAKEWTWT